MPIFLSQVNRQTRLQYWSGIYVPCVQKLPNNINPLDSTKNGTKQLEGEDELMSYMAAYGAHHYHKLQAAFLNANLGILHNRNIEIVDWGCGQAVATAILLDFLLAKEIFPIINRITLIEPSNDALQKGLSYLEKILIGNNDIGVSVRQVCNYLHEVSDSNVKSSAETVKIHLFSNILDIASVELDNLYQLVIRTNQGINKFICTGPYNPKRCRIDDFRQRFSKEYTLEDEFCSDQRLAHPYWKLGNNKSPPYSEYNITRYEQQFTVRL